MEDSESEIFELKDRYKKLSKEEFSKEEVNKYMSNYYPSSLRPYGQIKWKTLFKVSDIFHT